MSFRRRSGAQFLHHTCVQGWKVGFPFLVLWFVLVLLQGIARGDPVYVRHRSACSKCTVVSRGLLIEPSFNVSRTGIAQNRKKM